MTDQKKKEKTLNIYQKLVQVRKSVEYLKKEASGYKYNYTKESQVLGAIRPAMDELNLILEIDMVSLEEVDFPQWHAKSNQFVTGKGLRVVFEFCWINGDCPEERIIKKMTIQNDGIDAKAIGALYTYANRYFLMKYFQIATDNLDPDAHQKQVEAMQPINQAITQEQLADLELLLNGYDDIRKMVSDRFSGDLARMTPQQFGLARTWIENSIAKRNQENEKD